MVGALLRFGYRIALGSIELALAPLMLLLALLSRFSPRPVDVGLGPDAMINNIYHKQALERHGYSAETFVVNTNFIRQDYDVSYPRAGAFLLGRMLLPYWLFLRVIFRYRALFIYFNGGPLRLKPVYDWLEPFLYKAAGVKIVVMPFGSDVQDMTRSRNLYFRHTMAQDYPTVVKDHRGVARRIDRWSRHASWVISGCDWVDYMYYWNTLMPAHFSIDTDDWKPSGARPPEGPFRILHAPNHLSVKGTSALLRAIEALRAEGLDIELVLLRGVPNHQIRETIETVDLVADQFVIGWYAMFALEAMALEKPVLCYLRPDLIDLFEKAGLLQGAEIPLLNTDLTRIAEAIRWAHEHRTELPEIGRKGRAYAQRHHSTEAVGAVFAGIMRQLGLPPRRAPQTPERSPSLAAG